MFRIRKNFLFNYYRYDCLFVFLAPERETLAAPNRLESYTSQAFSCADFNTVRAGSSVEGLGTVLPDLNIEALGTAVAVADGVAPTAYKAPNDQGYINEGLESNGGFWDINLEHEYTFTFTPGLSVNLFNLRIRDFGDWNGINATWHQIALTAYNSNNEVVDVSVLEYTTNNLPRPTSSQFGNLYTSGDAVTAEVGQPGNHTFTVEGTAITRVELRFDSDTAPGSPSDDFYAFDALCFNIDQEIDTSYGTNCGDFSSLGAGASVEGLGTVLPNLNISAAGSAVALLERQGPTGFLSPNDAGAINVGAGNLGAFWDKDRLHQYEFSFTPGQTVSSFGLRLLDFGDWNGVNATWHQISLKAYDSAGNLVDSSIFEYNTDSNNRPTSILYGSLYYSGDAITALDGQPGNRAFVVQGSGISRIQLSFDNDSVPGKASDDFYGINLLCFETENNQPQIPYGSSCVDFSTIGAGGSIEGLGTVYPDLNISTLSGRGVAILERRAPTSFLAPNNVGTINYGVGPLGGFWDLGLKHSYDFSIASGKSVSSFGLRVIDFGDWNGVNATYHKIELTGYDANGTVVDTDTLEYETDSANRPTSPVFGSLYYSGDATVAEDGQPGNRAYVVEGEGITRIELRFDSDAAPDLASDDFYGIHLLCFEMETPPPPPPTGTPLTCEDIGQQTLAEDTWNESVSSSLAPVSLSFTPPAGADYALVNMGWEWTGDVNQAQVTQMHTVETPFGTTTSGDYGNGELVGQVFWYDVLQGAYDQPSMPITISYAGNGSDSGSNQSHGLISWCGTPPPPPQLDPPTADLTLLLVKPAPIIGGKYLVEYACSATAPNLVSATINGYDMINGQQIRLIVSDTPSVRYWYNEVLAIYAPEFSFDVTCADDLGNEVSTQVIPEFIIP